MIIRKATGNEVSTEFRNRFLNPLGLIQTFLDVEETIVGEMAHGWAEIYEDGIIEDMTTYPRTAYYSILWTDAHVLSCFGRRTSKQWIWSGCESI